MKKLTFDDVKDVRMPLGKYKGSTLDGIAETDEGLRYLDWLIGQDWLKGDLRNCVKAYLTDPAIAAEVKNLARSDR